MEKIETSLVETIETTDINSINKDLAEVVIDSVLDDGLLKDIPIVNIIVGLRNFGSKIHKGIFIKKVLTFLSNLESTTIRERQNFIQKIEKSETYNNKVGEALIMILEKCSDLEKPKIIGKLFKASIKEEIDYQTFLRLCSLIDRVHIPDLIHLKSIHNGQNINSVIKDELFRAGFLNRTEFGQVKIDGSNEYYINNYGKKFVELIL
ncbi:hypothetical protein [Seonamhaeicola maritimus]|uniref:DUF4393 domain-containing protein n=1 Tax=Seonamhaeicola maritimus TaxID=2591822 RepID=A0A5C7GHB2_9FLAO|nr:hypothetical protein [Seonamhaeicola maritimus]TXG36978.1 hypothetical protein FUA22_10430 [Seonamhaeicola maritimus]